MASSLVVNRLCICIVGECVCIVWLLKEYLQGVVVEILLVVVVVVGRVV